MKKETPPLLSKAEQINFYNRLPPAFAENPAEPPSLWFQPLSPGTKINQSHYTTQHQHTHQHQNTKNPFIYTEMKIIKSTLTLKLFVLLIFFNQKVL